MAKKTFCGVLEFSADEGLCYIPIWMMNNLFLEEGSEVCIRNANLKKGTFVAIQPHETAFINLSNPKAILECELTNYSCLYKGDTINVNSPYGASSGTIFKLIELGTSTKDELPFWAVKLSFNANLKQDKPRVLILGQCHAEEILGVEMSMELIDRFLHPEEHPTEYQTLAGIL